MAGTLSYRLHIEHVYQRRFSSTDLAEALASSHWYLITRRPSTRIAPDSVCIDDQILTVDFVTRDNFDSPVRVHTLGADFGPVGSLQDFQVYADGAYFSVMVNDRLIHGDAWALASLLSGASPEIARQEVLYVGQAFGDGGKNNAWTRTSSHSKLQRIYEDHVNTDCEIFVVPLSLDRSLMHDDDHIEDAEDGPNFTAFLQKFKITDGQIPKTAVDLIEHSLISYFVPHYNEKLTEWRVAAPTDSMRKMRSAGFRLLHVHLSGWWGLTRLYSAQVPDPVRSHFISQDLPPEPRRPTLRGISSTQMSEWRIGAILAREGEVIFANRAEATGASLRIFGDKAPSIRKPPGLTLPPTLPQQPQISHDTAVRDSIRRAIQQIRRWKNKTNKARLHSGRSSYDPSTGTITIGEYIDSTHTHWRLHDPDTGSVDSALIIGDPGGGKSNHLKLILAEALMTGSFFVMPWGAPDPRGINSLWSQIHQVRWDGASVDPTVDGLRAARRIIDARRTHTHYTKPCSEVPAVLLAIDDADATLQDAQGAQLACEVLSTGGKVGVGLLLVVSNIATLKDNSKLMRHLVSCDNKVAFSPDGQSMLADLMARHSEPRSHTWHDGGLSFVMYCGPEDTTLGLVTGVTTHEVMAREALSWCNAQLTSRGALTIGWQMVDDDPRSWWTIDAVAGRRWFLRQHWDAWALILILGNSPVALSRSSDAFRWASTIIDTRFTVDLAPWRIGPTTGEEGVTAFYADTVGNLTAKDYSQLIQRFLIDLH